MHDIYADVIGNIAVTGPMVRIDFLRVATPAEQQQTPRMEFSHRLVMPLDGFLRSLEAIEGIRNKLLADGVIKRQVATSASN